MHNSFSLEHSLKLSATSAFTVLCGERPARAALLVVGKVCNGFRLAVFVWFTLLFCLLLFLFFLWVRMNVSIHFTLHCVPSGARHAKRTAGLSSQSHRPPHSHSRLRLRPLRFRLRSVWRRKVQASQNKPCHSLLGIITIC